MKKTNSQHGFSVLVVIATIVLLAGLSFAGYYVWNKNSGDESKKNTTSGNGDKSPDASPEPTSETSVPDGFTLYKSMEFGFSFAYPKGLGQLIQSKGEPSDLLYASSSDIKDAFAPGTHSRLIVQAAKKDSFLARGGKCGPILEFSNGKWIVTAKNNGDVLNGGYEIGSEFDTSIIRTIDGISVYDLSFTDEGCHYTTWVFQLASAFVSMRLPSICADEINAIPEKRLAEYKEVSNQVLKSLQID